MSSAFFSALITLQSRLRRDARANVLPMMAIAIFPLAGVLGGALDISRSYLVKSRLQHACDASVLAGRRAMTASTFDQTARDTANRFFATNFTPGRYGTTDLSITYTVGTDMIVHGSAKANVPTTLMKLFGIKQVALSTACDAELQLPNSDIMFVLDTTLSMGETNPGDSLSKIATLRQSVNNFYTTLENAKSSSTQVRYGFVPYSSTVNVGLLLKREWMVNNWTYQSREMAEQDQVTSGGAGNTTTTYSGFTYVSGGKDTYKSVLPSESCFAQNSTTQTNNQYGPWDSPNPPQSRTQTQTLNGSSFSTALSNGVCTQTETRYTNYVQQRTQTVTPNPNAGQTTTTTRYWWNYKPVAYDVSAFKGNNASGLMSGGSFTATISNNHGLRTVSWPGTTGACIEERQTSNPSTSDAALDLDVDMVPSEFDPRTQWRPWLRDVVWARSVTNYGGSINGWTPNPVHTTTNYINLLSYPNDRAACAAASRKLGSITSSQLNTYLNTLKPAGYTYHDIGFLWGLRLMSPQGIFGAENQAAPNGGSVARHLIFMTDGDTETNIADYDAYGLSALDRRRTDPSRVPTADEQNTLVEDRLTRLCGVAKDQKNITVWVIAFGTSLTPLLTNCASPNRAYQANNAAELDRTFAEIASQISQLRITR